MLEVAGEEKAVSLRTAEASLQKQEREIHRLNAALAERDCEANEVRQSLQAEEKNSRWLQGQVDTLSAQLAEEEDRSREAGRLSVLVESRHEETTRLSGQVAALTTSLREADAQLAEKEGALAALTRQNQQLVGQVSALEQAVATERSSLTVDRQTQLEEAERMAAGLAGKDEEIRRLFEAVEEFKCVCTQQRLDLVAAGQRAEEAGLMVESLDRTQGLLRDQQDVLRAVKLEVPMHPPYPLPPLHPCPPVCSVPLAPPAPYPGVCL